MGCCTTREELEGLKIPVCTIDEDQNTEVFKSSMLEQASSLGIPELESIKDARVLDIVSYMEDLERDDSWELVKETENIQIKCLQGSKYEKDIPVSQIRHDFGRNVPLHIILEEIQVEKHRKEWDPNIWKMEILEGNLFNTYVTYNAIKVMSIYKGDFVERRNIFKFKNSVALVSYSIEHPKQPPVDGFNRGVNHFGIYLFSDRKDSTEMIYMCQTNPKSMLANMFKKEAPKKFYMWCNKLRKAVFKRLNQTLK